MLDAGFIRKIYGGRKTFENSRGFYQVVANRCAAVDGGAPAQKSISSIPKTPNPPSISAPAPPTLPMDANETPSPATTELGSQATATLGDGSNEGDGPAGEGTGLPDVGMVSRVATISGGLAATTPRGSFSILPGIRAAPASSNESKNTPEPSSKDRTGRGTPGLPALNNAMYRLKFAVQSLETRILCAEDNHIAMLKQQLALLDSQDTMRAGAVVMQQQCLVLLGVFLAVCVLAKAFPGSAGGVLVAVSILVVQQRGFRGFEYWLKELRAHLDTLQTGGKASKIKTRIDAIANTSSSAGTLGSGAVRPSTPSVGSGNAGRTWDQDTRDRAVSIMDGGQSRSPIPPPIDQKRQASGRGSNARPPPLPADSTASTAFPQVAMGSSNGHM